MSTIVGLPMVPTEAFQSMVQHFSQAIMAQSNNFLQMKQFMQASNSNIQAPQLKHLNLDMNMIQSMTANFPGSRAGPGHRRARPVPRAHPYPGPKNWNVFILLNISLILFKITLKNYIYKRAHFFQIY